MKLQDLFEDDSEDLEDAIKLCQPYLSMPGAKTGLLWRGVGTEDDRFQRTTLDDGTVVSWNIFNRRNYRQPKSTPLEYSEAMDEVFKKEFGWKPRQQGVFVTGSRGHASGYGKEYVCVPIGPTRFVWSGDVEDLFIICQNFRERQGDSVEKFKKFLLTLHYIDTDLSRAIKSHHEIMLDCDSYLLLYSTDRSKIKKLLDM
jgi:hypothetical protein